MQKQKPNQKQNKALGLGDIPTAPATAAEMLDGWEKIKIKWDECRRCM